MSRRTTGSHETDRLILQILIILDDFKYAGVDAKNSVDGFALLKNGFATFDPAMSFRLLNFRELRLVQVGE